MVGFFFGELNLVNEVVKTIKKTHWNHWNPRVAAVVIVGPPQVMVESLEVLVLSLPLSDLVPPVLTALPWKS